MINTKYINSILDELRSTGTTWVSLTFLRDVYLFSCETNNTKPFLTGYITMVKTHIKNWRPVSIQGKNGKWYHYGELRQTK